MYLATDNRHTEGLTVYHVQKILLVNTQVNLIRTLKHELTHVWLWEYGHNQHEEGKKYSYEDVCEIVANSNDFINEIVDKYKKEVKRRKV
jgi:Zn-dependent peptidase ImmA (M78 family)